MSKNDSLQTPTSSRQPTSQDPAAAIVLQIEQLTDRTRDALKELPRAEKALKNLHKSGQLVRGDALKKAIKALEKVTLNSIQADDQRLEIITAIEQHTEQQKKTIRTQFLGELTEKTSALTQPLHKIAESPLTFYLHPLTIEIDFEREKVTISYAREPVETTDLHAPSVLEAYQKTLDNIRKDAISSDTFFDLLLQAYRTVLIARGEKPGERVDLVDLLVPLSILQVNRNDWRKKGIAGIKEFPRHMLAYQLNRLRNDGLLERAGMRLELGTATGGSTKDKRNVLFVPSAQAEGQYYLSIRFT